MKMSDTNKTCYLPINMELRRIGVYTITVDPTILTIRFLNDEEIKVYYSGGYLDLYDKLQRKLLDTRMSEDDIGTFLILSGYSCKEIKSIIESTEPDSRHKKGYTTINERHSETFK